MFWKLLSKWKPLQIFKVSCRKVWIIFRKYNENALLVAISLLSLLYASIQIIFKSSNKSGIDRDKPNTREYRYISSSNDKDSDVEDRLNIFKEKFFNSKPNF